VTKSFVILIWLWVTGILLAVTGDFSHYEIILEKKPFGDAPPEPEQETIQVAPNQSFARNLRLSMLYEGPNGDIRAGIIDTSRNTNFILSVGEMVEGLELLDADLSRSEATVKKGNEVALFKMEQSQQPQTLSKREQKARTTSYAQRRRALLKKIEDQKKKEEKPKEPALTGEALRKHLEQVQMDAIRNGLPPLPMPLTKEMDDQLVKEGVLPPQ
jgi:hypothetical protein